MIGCQVITTRSTRDKIYGLFVSLSGGKILTADFIDDDKHGLEYEDMDPILFRCELGYTPLVPKSTCKCGFETISLGILPAYIFESY